MEGTLEGELDCGHFSQKWFEQGKKLTAEQKQNLREAYSLIVLSEKPAEIKEELYAIRPRNLTEEKRREFLKKAAEITQDYSPEEINWLGKTAGELGLRYMFLRLKQGENALA